MTTSYDLYVVACTDLDQGRHLLEPALGVTLQPHESGFHGGEYFRLGDGGHEHFIFKRNFDGAAEEWAEPEFQAARFLLYVNETGRGAELRARLGAVSGVTHLRTDRFD